MILLSILGTLRDMPTGAADVFMGKDQKCPAHR